MNDLPSGTVSFLFTDVEGSTRFWERDSEGMRGALGRHDRALREAVETNGGALFKKTGDGIFAAFSEASQAVAAAIAAQREIVSWGADSLPVRMAVYTGPAQESEGDYVGPTLNRTARMLAIGHGGQILISQTSRDLLLDCLPAGATLLDLGIHSLKDLERPEQVYQLQHPNLRADFPPLRSLATFRHNLPVQLTSLIGRQEEIRQIRELLEGHRLVTLYGSGGCGKTRLALQVGAEVVDSFPDGVWLVELGGAVDSVQAEQALVSVLGLREEGGRDTGQVVMEYLRERNALIILDNCEHLVEACAKQGEELLRACSHLKVLTTSREVLGVVGEVTFRVPSLPVPDTLTNPTPERVREIEAADSVQLFRDRASDVLPGFALRIENAGYIAEITRRLEGIPLAIELAAARIKTLTPEQISERLRDHFSILGRPRGGPSRHATLRATMDWSYSLLDEREKALLARLSVFAGSWTLEAAESVCVAGVRGRPSPEPFEREDMVDLLARLEDKSLVLMDRQSESPRYRMLQMVKEYSSEHLTEPEPIANRHLEYFLGIAEEAEANLSGPKQAGWLKRLDSEHDNLRAALDHARRNPDLSESGLRLAGSLARYWHIRGILSEGRRQLTSIMALSPYHDPSIGRGMAYNGAGILAWAQENLPEARSYLQKALQNWNALQHSLRAAGALSNLALVEIQERHYDSGIEFLEKSLRIRRELNDLVGVANCLNNMGIVARYEKQLDLAWQCHEEALRLRESDRNSSGIAESLNNLGEVAYHRGEFEAARSYFERCLAIFHELEDKGRAVLAAFNVAEACLALDELDLAERGYLESIELADAIGKVSAIEAGRCRLGDIARLRGQPDRAHGFYAVALKSAAVRNAPGYVACSLERLGLMEMDRNEYERGALLLGAAESVRSGARESETVFDDTEIQAKISALKFGQHAASYVSAWESGKSMETQKAIEVALSGVPG